MVSEIPGPYQSIADGFSEESLKGKGMTMLSKETIDFNNSKATFVRVSQQASGRTYLKQILMFGDDKETVLITGIYPEEKKSMEENIKAALVSTVYISSINANTPDAANFTVSTAGTEFKFARFIVGSLAYSADGKIPTEKSTLIIANSINKASIQDQRQFSEQRLRNLPRGEFNVIKEVKEVTINNLNGYEIVAEGKGKNNEPELVYQVTLFTDKGDYYMIVGQGKENFEKTLQDFRTIARTFRLK